MNISMAAASPFTFTFTVLLPPLRQPKLLRIHVCTRRRRIARIPTRTRRRALRRAAKPGPIAVGPPGARLLRWPRRRRGAVEPHLATPRAVRRGQPDAQTVLASGANDFDAADTIVPDRAKRLLWSSCAIRPALRVKPRVSLLRRPAAPWAVHRTAPARLCLG